MSTSDQNSAPPRGDEQDSGTETAAAPQVESGGERGSRHDRGRRRGRRPERPQQQASAPRRGEATLNIDELRELTELFSTHGLTDFEFENAEIRIRLSRTPAPVAGTTEQHAPAPSAPLAAMHAATPGAAPAPQANYAAAQAESANAAAQAEEALHIITSPIVGTFYRAAGPTVEAFVKVGSHVEPDTVVCIIEAMKLMNEIQAETTGTVEKIYVENGQPVEYGQPLFGIKK